MKHNRSVHIHEDLESMSRAAAEKLVDIVDETVRDRGRCALALSGGSTPRKLYRLLADEFRDAIPWAHMHLFWGDERCVPADHRDSNYRLAEISLISKVAIPAANIYKIPASSLSPQEAAERYETVLRAFFESEGRESSPSFDLTLLGIGADGHTASLFPGSPALREKRRWVMPVSAPEKIFPRERITITLPLLNESRFVFFLVSGADKKRIVQSILTEPETARERLPAARIAAHNTIFWHLDKDAAGSGCIEISHD